MSISFYISCSKADLPKLKGLEKYLKSIDHSNPARIFTKNDIYVGENENRRIVEFIKNSSIIICIITVDYLQECKSEIFEIFNESPIIIPVLFKKCNLEGSQFETLKILDFPGFKENNSEEGIEDFWNYVSENVKSRYKNELKLQKRIEEERVISGYAGVAIDSDQAILHLNLDEIDINQKINKFNKGELKILVFGDSMIPDIQNSDLLTCKFVNTSIKIVKSSSKELYPELKKNKFYVIETRDQGIMIKYIQYVENKIILISKNPNYTPIVLNPEDVISIWEVTSIFRSL